MNKHDAAHYAIAAALAVGLGGFACCAALAQQTKATLNTYNGAHFAANGVGAITGPILNTMNADFITSFCGLAQTSDCPLPGLALSASGAPLIPVAALPAGGFYASPSGAGVVLCSATVVGWAYGCPQSYPNSNYSVLTQSAGVMQTAGNAYTSESGLTLFMSVATGYESAWAISTGYTSTSIVDDGGLLYQQVSGSSCTSAGSGGGPSGTSATPVADNTCSWQYEGPIWSNSKNNLNVITVANAGGGRTWSIATGLTLNAGFNAPAAFEGEIDFTNNTSIDPAFASGFTYDNLYLGGNIGTNPGTTAINIAPKVNGTNYGYHEGLFINGTYSIKDHAIHVFTNSAIGYYDQSASHSVATFFDGATTPVAINLTGTYSAAALEIPSGSNICLSAGSDCFKWDGTYVNFGAQPIQGGGLYLTGAAAMTATVESTAAATNFVISGGSGQTETLTFNLHGTGYEWQLKNGSTNVLGVYDAQNAYAAALTFITGGNIALGETAAGTLNIQSSAIQVGGTATVSCSAGVPSASFTVKNGLVTHC